MLRTMQKGEKKFFLIKLGYITLTTIQSENKKMARNKKQG